MNHAGMRARILAVALSSAITLVVALVLAEVAVRHRERTRNTVPGALPIYYPHERLRQALIRNTSYYQWVRVNGQGFRGTRDVEPRTPTAVRIIAVGESTTFDAFVTADTLTWPAQLERQLAAKAPCPVEVFNAGVPGYRVLDNVIRLHTELVHFQPDILLFYHPHNDLFAAVRTSDSTLVARMDRPNEAEYSSPWSRELSRRSLLYAKVRSRAQVMRGRQMARVNRPTPAVLQQAARRYEDEIDTFIALAGVRGIATLLIQGTHVSGAGAQVETDSALVQEWRASFPMLSSHELLATYEQFFRAMQAAAATHRAPVIETASFGLRGPEWYAAGDPIHFNDRGAERMAERLASSALLLDAISRLCAERSAGTRILPEKLP